MANDNIHEQCDFDSSWSKYQMMVLQQLADHTQVLQNLNSNVSEHKQAMAVHLAELAMWKAHINESIANLQKSIDEMLYDERGVAKRVAALEQHQSTENQIDLRSKNNWQTMSAFIVTASVIVNLLIQMLQTFVKK